MNQLIRMFITILVITSCGKEPSFVENSTSNRDAKADELKSKSSTTPSASTSPGSNPGGKPGEEIEASSSSNPSGSTVPGSSTNPPKSPSTSPSSMPKGWMTVEKEFTSDITSTQQISADLNNPYFSYDLVMQSKSDSETKQFNQVTRDQVFEDFQQGYLGDQNVETFTQNLDQRKLDIALVIDNSGSMAEEQVNMATKLSSLLSSIQTTDWQIGITTSDPNDGCLIALIKKTDANYQDKFARAVQAGIQGSGEERGILQAVKLLQSNCTAQKWVRDTSNVAVLIVSDEDNCSNGLDASCVGQPYASENYLYDYLSTIRTPGSNARVYGLFWHPSMSKSQCSTGYNVGNAYAQIVERTSGAWGSICDQDYSSALSNISKNISSSLNSRFTLRGAPTNAKVYVDQVLQTTGYFVSGNILEFTTPPKSGATVRVEYMSNALPILTSFPLKFTPVTQGISVKVNGVVVSPLSYAIDYNQNLLIFNQAPAAKSAIQISYKKYQELLRQFSIGSIVDTNTLIVKVNQVNSLDYVYSSATGMLLFNMAPAEGASISMSYKTLPTPVLSYPLVLSNAQISEVKVFDKNTSAAVAATYQSGVITFAAQEFAVGRAVVVQYKNPSLDRFVLTLPVNPAANSIKVSDGVNSCTVNNGLVVQNNVISLRDCMFIANVQNVLISYDLVLQSITQFVLDAQDLPKEEAPQVWTVWVNGVEKQDYIKNKNVISFRTTLPSGSKVKIQVRYEKQVTVAT